ncbi:hypothetical protein [Lunatibacter salilacus]|uniref:hypothetical protein n=1 Tax=Lunatibacter salilacus TaxID=2483804 RepID=UPI001F33535F|nr:hypothetical protein [Lunatibacter salilacus]
MKPKSALVVLRVVSVHNNSYMKSHIPVYLILLLSLTLLGSNARPGEKLASTVAINPNRTLGWEDFKVVKVIQGKSTINAICLSTCEVEILRVTPRGKHASLDVRAKVQHQPELSQVTESFLANNDAATKAQVLHHENGHFLIAQIIGHRIVKDAQGYAFDPKNYKVQLNQIIKTHFRSWNQMDQLYDLESTNPRNPVMQKKWDDYFEKELNKFKETSN